MSEIAIGQVEQSLNTVNNLEKLGINEKRTYEVIQRIRKIAILVNVNISKMAMKM